MLDITSFRPQFIESLVFVMIVFAVWYNEYLGRINQNLNFFIFAHLFTYSISSKSILSQIASLVMLGYM